MYFSWGAFRIESILPGKDVINAAPNVINEPYIKNLNPFNQGFPLVKR